MTIDISVTSDKPNKLLKRRELECSASYDGSTVSRAELKNELVHKLALNPDLTVIVSIRQEYGLKRSKAVVHVYDTKEAMGIAQKHLLERGVKKEKKEPETKATATVSSGNGDAASK
ncbi:MAG: 30S ribosomal protein S24e [Candidatus Micrarchaeia archaeon]